MTIFSWVKAGLLTSALLHLLLSGCASTPQSQRLLQHPPEYLQNKVELNEVGFFPQREYQCGPAALATVLNYRNVNVEPDTLTDKVYIPQRKGSLQLEMVVTARSYGVLAYKLEPQLNALIAEINNGNPVLVFQNLSLQFWPLWHYAVVIGYDLNKGELILRSGTIRRHITSFSTFERTWQRAGYWAYVFVQPGNIPFTATPLNYTQSGYDLQQAGFMEQALKAFRQGAKKWPDNSIVLMAWGNAEFEAGNLLNATEAFKRELEHRTKNPTAWNNLAYALAIRNCKTQALKAVTCAQRLAPDDTNIQQSVAEIQKMPATDAGSCEDVVCPLDKAPDSD